MAEGTACAGGSLAVEEGCLFNFHERGGGPWISNQWQRARLLRKLGRQPQAREIETELRKLLAYADSDLTVLRELRQLSRQEELGLGPSP